ncbi:Protein rarD [Methylophaga frappieri]|uniref:Protein rarD n=1 Tax=Methylophaga frappieri (strain ATCC BAA-2434 / DSM 25690 / JAM7) TaxID=754477 RepID=I1YHH0_METFJ|nr:EamA family transporter RarD [Methylophaga frappieri]AFJ02363.1 Protein rarD [Methylophaga frappieri]
MHGLILAISAYLIWGGFPLFFHYLSHVAATEVLAHRIVWSFMATLLLGLILGRGRTLRRLISDGHQMRWLFLSALLIAINWLIYIWAVSQQRVLEASLGYFITPVLSLLLARLILKETLHLLQWWAAAFAGLAIAWELISLKTLPWIGLSLAIAFALYGLIRKQHPVDGLNGLTAECLTLLPLTLIWFIWQISFYPATLAFGHNAFNTTMLISAGLLTALPLVLFAMAAKRADLSVVGFFMYLNPTVQFLIGVFVLHEAYPPERQITFILIWIGMLLFIAGMWRQRQQRRST